MGKKKRWFTYVKRLFHRESKPKSEESLQKPKKWSWFLEKFKFNHYPTLEAPHEKTLNDATEEHRKQALTLAIATAAAAEAAVAAANAAAEVVRLSHTPYDLIRKNQCLAAIRIQSTFRGHLARKALSALKGIVKLQAVVRGQLVRSSIAKRLASMALLLKPKPEVHQERVLTLVDYLKTREKRHSFSRKQVINSEELQCYSLRDWEFSMVSTDGSESFNLRKQDAVAKRERMKQYSISNRERRTDQSLHELSHKGSRKTNRVDQFKELEVHQHEGTKLKLRTTLKQEIAENLHPSFSLPRRSLCHIKQKSIGDDGSLPSSPVFPPYMAATESAKAKCRSLSTPRQRFRLFETYSGPNSPHKISLSSWSSFNGDSTNSSKRNSISKQTSTLR